MDRCVFLSAVAGGLVAVGQSAIVRAQPKVARVGFLTFASRKSALEVSRCQAFVQGMRESLARLRPAGAAAERATRRLSATSRVLRRAARARSLRRAWRPPA